LETNVEELDGLVKFKKEISVKMEGSKNTERGPAPRVFE
jgi:hypothetical protein